MERSVSLNRKGLTLVEVMIALVVLLFVSMAMMQTALVSIDSNMKNILRTEAVAVAEKTVNDMRNLTFNAGGTDAELAETAWTDVPPTPEIRHVRGADVSFSRQKQIIDRGINNKDVSVQVKWDWKGTTYEYTFSTVLKRSGI